MNYRISTFLGGAILAVSLLPGVSSASQWATTQASSGMSASSHSTGGVYNGDFGTRRATDLGNVAVAQGRTTTGPTGSLTFNRNVSILNNISVGSGGLSYDFNPLKPGDCGKIAYTYDIPKTPATVYANGTCTGNGGIRVSGGGSISHSVDVGKWWYFGVSITPSVNVKLGVDLTAEAGPQGQWGRVKHPIYWGGVRAPDYLKLTVAPYASGGLGIAASPFDWWICTVSLNGSITIAKVQPEASFEVGYKLAGKSARRFRYYTDARLGVTVSGGGGNVTLKKSVFGIPIFTLTLISWDPIYTFKANLWQEFYKLPFSLAPLARI